MSMLFEKLTETRKRRWWWWRRWRERKKSTTLNTYTFPKQLCFSSLSSSVVFFFVVVAAIVHCTMHTLNVTALNRRGSFLQLFEFWHHTNWINTLIEHIQKIQCINFIANIFSLIPNKANMQTLEMRMSRFDLLAHRSFLASDFRNGHFWWWIYVYFEFGFSIKILIKIDSSIQMTKYFISIEKKRIFFTAQKSYFKQRTESFKIHCLIWQIV